MNRDKVDSAGPREGMGLYTEGCRGWVSRAASFSLVMVAGRQKATGRMFLGYICRSSRISQGFGHYPKGDCSLWPPY